MEGARAALAAITKESKVSKRIYIVEHEGGQKNLVDALSAAGAVKHVVRELYKVRIAKAREIADMLAEGFTVEDADPAVDPTGGA